MASLFKAFQSPRRGGKAPAAPARRQGSDFVMTRDTFAPQQADVPDEEIWEGIPKEFFEEECDAALFTLQNLPDELTIATLEREQAHQTRALDMVDSKLSGVIMDNYKAFVQGMSRVEEFSTDLKTTTFLLRTSRQHLEQARKGLTGGGMEIVAKARKLRVLQRMFEDVTAIKNLRAKDASMLKAMDDGDFPRAIELCADCQLDVDTYKHYKSVRDLETKFNEAMETIGDRLDKALQTCCRTFDATAYENALIGYKLQGKPHRVIDVVVTHLSDLVDIVSHECALASVAAATAGDRAATTERYKGRPFKELCGMIKDDADYIQFLRTLMATHCNLMLNLYKMIQWHEQPLPSGEANHYFKETGERLRRARKSLWDDVQRKLCATLAAKSLVTFKFEDFLTALNLINRVINVGDIFTGTQSPTLRTAIKQHAVTYFKAAHRQRMENLKTMLENESWYICPVRPDFGIDNMREFDFSNNVSVAPVATDAAPAEAAAGPEGPLVLPLFEDAMAHGGFTLDEDEAAAATTTNNNSSKGANGRARDAGADSGSDDDGADDDAVDKPLPTPGGGGGGGGAPKLQRTSTDDESINATVRARRRAAALAAAEAEGQKAPILASTTVNVVRFIGRYLSLSQILSPIAYDVLIGLAQLVEYYVYTVFKLFTADTAGKGVDLLGPNDPLLPPRLRTTLLRLRARFDERPPDALALQDAAADSVMETRYTVPALSPSVEIRNPTLLYALANRVTAIESIAYLDKVMRSVRDRVEPLVPPARKEFLLQFYSQTIEVIPELRRYMYRCVSRKLISFDGAIAQIEKINWDMREIGSDTSPYVDTLMKEFIQFKSRLQSDPRLQALPAEIPELLWRGTITFAIESLVEGYCRAKKVSSEGRAQMQLDFKTLQANLEQLSNLRPLPYVHYMDTFLKSYYLSEDDAEPWIHKYSREYTAKQLAHMITTGVGTRVSKKERQAMLQLIEDLDKQRR